MVHDVRICFEQRDEMIDRCLVTLITNIRRVWRYLTREEYLIHFIPLLRKTASSHLLEEAYLVAVDKTVEKGRGDIATLVASEVFADITV